METKKIFSIIGVVIIALAVAWIVSKYSIDYQKTNNQTKLWVWVELKITLPRDTTDYFYYGQINESIIEKIESDEDENGLFILSNIRYWNDDDLLQVYEDKDHYDYKIFHIQDIQQLIPYKADPINVLEIDELHETTKALRDPTSY
jgi:hypothetical protein